jgi:hypothetical protein
MMEDESHLVRRECVNHLQLTTIRQLDILAAKTRDSTPEVRQETYKRLKADLPKLILPVDSPLPIPLILSLIENGLSDPSEIVTNSCVDFIKTWLLIDQNQPVPANNSRGRKAHNPEKPLVPLEAVLKALRI